MPLGTNPRIWFVLLVIVAGTFLVGVQDSIAQQDAAGTWVATVTTPMGEEVEITLILEKSETGWTGIVKDPQETVDAEHLVVNGNLVSFDIPNPQLGITAKFAGTIDESGNKLDGSASIPNFPAQKFTFIRQVNQVVTKDGNKKYRVGSGPAGVWIGRVRAPDGEDSRVTLTLDKDGSGWFATIEDPFVNVVRGENVKVTDTMISFIYRPEGAPFPSTFSGTYIAADDRVTGSFSQRGTSRFVKFERDPSTITLGLGPDGEPIQPPRVRHAYHFALTGRISFWPSLHVVKDETYNINTLTSSTTNFDGTFRYFIMDGFNVFVRGFRGGQGFDSDSAKLAAFADIGLNADSYLKLDGIEFGTMVYMGNTISSTSDFNPYFTVAVGSTSWELTASDRGSEILAKDEQEFSGTDFSFAAGLGTEYELSSSFCLEFEFLWRYFMTADTDKWPDEDEVWSNTHAWSLSAGLTYGFF